MNRLKAFGERVTRQLSKEGATENLTGEVERYVAAVGKAASDKDRRQARHEILVRLLQPYFG